MQCEVGTGQFLQAPRQSLCTVVLHQLCTPECQGALGMEQRTPWTSGRGTDMEGSFYEPQGTPAMRLLIILVLLGTCCLTACTVEGVGSEVLEKSICVSLTTRRLPIKHIKTYTIKEGSMKAVIFITKRGLKVCADPQVEWVKKAIKTVNNSARRNVKQTEPVGAPQPTHTAVTLTG
ncbi:Lymphotactin [Manis javanica]|nr:Lymphotactin [Manis javanica]